MKIGIMHYTVSKERMSGVEVVMNNHAKILSKHGYGIHLIFGSGGGLGYENIVEHEIPLLSPDHPRVQEVQKEIMEVRKETSRFKKLKDDIKKELSRILSDFSTCIVHNIPSMPFNFAATTAINELADELEKINMIFWLHDTIVVREEWKDRLGEFPVVLLHHNNPEITYVTPTYFRANQFAELEEPYKITGMKVIPNGVSVEEYIKIDGITKLLMKKLDMFFDDLVIVTPVRVVPRKNIELALYVTDQLKHLIGEKKKIKLLITGPPGQDSEAVEYMNKLQEIIRKLQIQDEVVFCHDLISSKRESHRGKTVRWSVADVYNIADLIFVPSKEEGFGLPVIEAGAARKPVFCSRIPPFQELIREHIEGYMFDLMNPPADIAFRIYKLFLGDVVNNNFDQVVKRFDWESVVLTNMVPLLR